MAAVWPRSPGEAVPVPMAVLLVWFGHHTHWKLGGGAAKLEEPRHYLTCFELQTPKKVTPAMIWTVPGGTPGWLSKVCQPGTVWEYWLHWLAPAQCPCNAKLGSPSSQSPLPALGWGLWLTVSFLTSWRVAGGFVLLGQGYGCEHHFVPASSLRREPEAGR